MKMIFSIMSICLFVSVSLVFADEMKERVNIEEDDFNNPVIKEDGTLVKTMDMNKDGKEEFWLYSLGDGAVQKVVRDLDFDGKVDAVQWTFLRDKKVGEFEKILYDDNNDGQVDRVEYYDTDNKVIRSEANPG